MVYTVKRQCYPFFFKKPYLSKFPIVGGTDVQDSQTHMPCLDGPFENQLSWWPGFFFSLYLIGMEIAAKYVSLWFPQVRTSKECFYSSTDWAAGSQTAFKQAKPLCALSGPTDPLSKAM